MKAFQCILFLVRWLGITAMATSENLRKFAMICRQLNECLGPRASDYSICLFNGTDLEILATDEHRINLDLKQDELLSQCLDKITIPFPLQLNEDYLPDDFYDLSDLDMDDLPDTLILINTMNK